MGKNPLLAPREGTWSKMSHEPKSLQVMDDWSMIMLCALSSATLPPVLKLKYPLKCASLSLSLPLLIGFSAWFLSPEKFHDFWETCLAWPELGRCLCAQRTPWLQPLGWSRSLLGLESSLCTSMNEWSLLDTVFFFYNSSRSKSGTST